MELFIDHNYKNHHIIYMMILEAFKVAKKKVKNNNGHNRRHVHDCKTKVANIYNSNKIKEVMGINYKMMSKHPQLIFVEGDYVFMYNLTHGEGFYVGEDKNGYKTYLYKEGGWVRINYKDSSHICVLGIIRSQVIGGAASNLTQKQIKNSLNLIEPEIKKISGIDISNKYESKGEIGAKLLNMLDKSTSD